MEFLIMLAPTVLSLSIFEALTQSRDTWFRIKYFCNSSLLINGVALALLYLLRGQNLNFDFALQRPDTLLKFLAVYVLVAVVVALFSVCFSNRIQMKVEKNTP